jgi:hypothetical protein
MDLSEKLIVALKEKTPSAALLQTPSLAAASSERARITIDASAANAEVFIDGALVGMTPVDDLALPAGAHSLEVRKDGFKRWTREIQVAPGGSSRFFAELTPL